MIVSWEWLGQYVALEMPLEDLTDRLTMSGLNLEGTESVAEDTAIDLEVTSNRPDCLGHVGVAREVSVLYGLPLDIPDPQPPTASDSVNDATSVEITCPELCPRYTARVLRGVQVGASPDWLVRRLATLGIASVNNIVDATNYVMSRLDSMDEREAAILRMRFGLEGHEPMTLKEIGAQLGLTRERVRQIETAALKRLAGELRGPGHQVSLSLRTAG